MVTVRKYELPPTALMPNSPRPLLHYPGLLAPEGEQKDDKPCSPAQVHDLLRSNGWHIQWIFRYGQTQTAHYHSRVHECMAVMSGQATIRFGVADTSADLEASTHGTGHEQGGIEIPAQKGDVFVLPAGLAHKTFDTRPKADYALLTSGDGHHVLLPETSASDGGDYAHGGGGDVDPVRDALSQLSLDGFTMLGAYPDDGAEWDFAKGGESEGQYEKVWAVPRPSRDPVLGDAEEGICGQWKE